MGVTPRTGSIPVPGSKTHDLQALVSSTSSSAFRCRPLFARFGQFRSLCLLRLEDRTGRMCRCEVSVPHVVVIVPRGSLPLPQVLAEAGCLIFLLVGIL